MTALTGIRRAPARHGPVGVLTYLAGVDDALFAAAAVRPADRVLDVGCGTGATTRIAARLASRGHALGVDVSGPLLRTAQELTAAQKIHNAAYKEADAQVHPFPPCGYDVIVSRSGVLNLADHPAAFRNLARALMPGGRLAFVWSGPAGQDTGEARALHLLGELLNGRDPETAGAATGPPCDPGRVRAALEGWADVEITPLALDTLWGRDAADAVDFVLSRPPGRTVSVETRRALVDSLRPYESGLGLRLRATLRLVTANRPRTRHRPRRAPAPGD